MAVQPKSIRPSVPADARRKRATGAVAARASASRRRGVQVRLSRRLGSPVAPSAAAAASSRAVPRPSVPDRGAGLLVVFLAATLIMIVAITVVGLVDRWWVLVPVMLVDFAATFGVIATITGLLADDGEPQT